MTGLSYLQNNHARDARDSTKGLERFGSVFGIQPRPPGDLRYIRSEPAAHIRKRRAGFDAHPRACQLLLKRPALVMGRPGSPCDGGLLGHHLRVHRSAAAFPHGSSANMRRQFIRLRVHRTSRSDEKTFDGIAQLAHVAGPRVTRQSGNDIFAQGRIRKSELLAQRPVEKFRQKGDVG